MLRKPLSSMIKGIKQGMVSPIAEQTTKRSMVHVDDVSKSILFLMENKSVNMQIYSTTQTI